jgi:hydrogenase-1 operon protein HyaF
MVSANGIFGPGSQPLDEDGAELDYMEMPKGMRTYAMPIIPEKDEAEAFEPALAKMDDVLAVLRLPFEPGKTTGVELSGLDRENREFISQLLGEGEVSIICGNSIQAQEAVLAGVWRVYETDGASRVVSDRIEVGEFPASILRAAQDAAGPALLAAQISADPNLMNAPALATELSSKLASYKEGDAAHVINLSLLPMSEADTAFVDASLGTGPVTILSRGYGNCRISSTAVKHVWRVRFFNSREAIILDTIEMTRIPSVALAAKEDLEDSAQRLKEILEVYR